MITRQKVRKIGCFVSDEVLMMLDGRVAYSLFPSRFSSSHQRPQATSVAVSSSAGDKAAQDLRSPSFGIFKSLSFNLACRVTHFFLQD
jgi:hypothetical protein